MKKNTPARIIQFFHWVCKGDYLIKGKKHQCPFLKIIGISAVSKACAVYLPSHRKKVQVTGHLYVTKVKIGFWPFSVDSD